MIVKFLGVIALLATLTFGIARMIHAGDAGTLTELDKQVLLRTQAQLSLIQAQAEKQAQPLLDEQKSVLNRVCSAVHATYWTDCQINLNNGTVSKTPTGSTNSGPKTNPPPGK
jgi:phage-related minor tail protein